MNQVLNILVCDENQTFFRYFRKTFPEFNFSFFSDEKKDAFLIDKFDRIIFIQEGPIEEYMIFFTQFEEKIPIIFGIYERRPIPAKYQIILTTNVKILYLLETKKEISNQLKEYFDNVVL
ncbi:hypothetical protein [Flavobacterium lipolyticum]|uniref:Response regulator n=1 Tax=Flavobacterium lipolyticum TaxID=2893754 RepID=A0ABS8M408_9FLAO|nr:hypothetical protein [Flavobacterium sp. F-126]MCC9019558.1 hypothetical protein [Flavobacterium sp. F-126]